MAENPGAGRTAAALRTVRRLLSWAAPLALAAAVAILAPADAERRMSMKTEYPGTDPGRGPVPPIDAAAPSRTETATFAMG